MNNYVLNHNFGYGNNKKNINKLNLRNIEDLKEYLKDVLNNQLDFPFSQENNKFSNETFNVCIEVEESA